MPTIAQEARERLHRFQVRVRSHPNTFIEKAHGSKNWARQKDIVNAIFHGPKRHTSVPGCTSSGKTHVIADVALAWLAAYAPAKVYTIAPTARQVRTVIWSAINERFLRLKYALSPGIRPTLTEYRLAPTWFALGVSTDSPINVRGFHGQNVLVIIDEANGIPKAVYNELENIKADGLSRTVMLFNPSELSGETADSMTIHRNDYNLIPISAFDTPNVRARRIVYPGLITYDQVMAWKKKYGEESDFYRVKVLAELPKQEPGTLIPLSWIEQAMMRTVPQLENARGALGVDVARFGNDNSCLVKKIGRQIHMPITLHGNNLMEVTGHVVRILKDDAGLTAYIDEIGLGAGVVDRTLELELPCEGINVSKSSSDTSRFANLRSEIWWDTREALNPENPQAIALPKSQRLAAQLSSVRYTINSKGQIVIEAKDSMKKRLGESPDEADALNNAVHGDKRRESSAEFESADEMSGEHSFSEMPDVSDLGAGGARGDFLTGLEHGPIDY